MNSSTSANALTPGTVLGIVSGQCKAQTREEWDAAVQKVWGDFIAEMSTNDGYKGAYSTWDTDHPRQVTIVGIWQSMEHRLAYEAKSATKVRGYFNPLIENPQRTRLTIGRVA